MASIPQGRESGESDHHPCSCQGLGYRPQTEFFHGDRWLLCPLLPPVSLLKEPGERVRLREATGSPQHAQQVADSWSRAPSLSFHLLFKIKVVGDAGPQQDFLRGVGGGAGGDRDLVLKESYKPVLGWLIYLRSARECVICHWPMCH